MHAKSAGAWRRRRATIWLVAIVVAVFLTHGGRPSAQGQPKPTQQDEFVPIDRLPSQEALPATPLVTIAYAFAWLAIFGYLWSIWRRLGRVEQEIADVTRRVQQGGLAAPKPRAGEGGAR